MAAYIRSQFNRNILVKNQNANNIGRTDDISETYDIGYTTYVVTKVSPIENYKQAITAHFETLKLYLTDIIAAEESGFGSESIQSFGNWLVGHIILKRALLIVEISDKKFLLDWSNAEHHAYLNHAYLNMDGSKNNRLSFKGLLSNLVTTQTTIIDILDNFEPTQIEAFAEVIEMNASQEFERVLELTQEKRKSGKTGIY